MTTPIDDEVQFHIDEAVDTLISQGWTAEAARAEAERRFGDSVGYRRKLSALTHASSTSEDLRRWFAVDWRDAVRSLRAAPVITLAAVLSLALGIGANTALFSIVNGLLLRPLPVSEPHRLALIERGSWTNPIWEQIRDRHSHLFAGAAAWSNETFDLAETGESQRVDGVYVSGGFFTLLGVRAAGGRTFTTSDDVRGLGPDGPVAVISHGLWQGRFGGAANIVGRRLTVNRLPFTIVGVMPAAFFGPEVGRSAHVYLPIAAEGLIRGRESGLDERSAWWLQMIVRLLPSQTIDTTAAALNHARTDIRASTIPERIPPQMRASYLGDDFTLVDATTGRSTLRTRFATPLTIIMVIVSGVLLIACANVANLLLARATARRQEMSVRLALGASRARIARQLLAEALVLSALGSVMGLVLAHFGGALLVRQLGSAVSTVTLDLSLDWRVLGMTAAVAVVTTVFFGLAPAAGLAGIEPGLALREVGRGDVGDRRLGLRNVLVVVQVALSVVLVVGATLFVRTFHGLATTPLGFSADHLVIVNVDSNRSGIGQDALAGLYQRTADAAAGVGGVRNASASLITPLSGRGWNARVAMPDGSKPAGDRISFRNAIGPSWFATYGMRILAGRNLSPADRETTPPGVVVNELFVRRFLGETPAIGARVRLGEAPALETFEVVGVVNDAVYRSARGGVLATMYHPLGQPGSLNASFSVTLDVPGDRGELIPALREALPKVNPAIAFSIRDYADQIGAAIAQERLVAMLSGFFGVLALLLAAIGLYGVTSYAVGRRTRELAVRMALGADARKVVRLVLRGVGAVVACGTAIGMALSLWASRFVESMLFGVQARDPLTLAAAALVIAAVGALAGWLPARRAARLDPNVVLRQ